MNEFAFNGSALNGVATQLIQAAANVVCSASIVASATRNVLPLAAITASAEVVATSTHKQAAAADVAGTAGISATAKHIQAGRALFDGSAEILASVRRVVQAEAVFECSAQMIVIPASTLGGANITGSASVVATGTKIQPASAAASATANVVANARVTRFVSAQIAGGAQLRVEAKVNNKLDAFADITGTANIAVPDVGIVIRLAEALVDCRAEVVPAVAYMHTSTKAAVEAGAEIVASATIQAITGAYFRTGPGETSTSIVANATRVVNPSVLIEVRADAAARAVLRHAAAAETIAGSADVLANAHRRVPADLAFTTSATVTPIGTAVRGAQAEVGGAATVIADPVVTRYAATDVQASAQIIALPTVFRQASANVAASADMGAGAVIIRFAAADITGSADAAASAMRLTMASADITGSADASATARMVHMANALVDASATFTANPRTNADAMDPPERTLRRPFEDTTMRRPYELREMRRAA